MTDLPTWKSLLSRDENHWRLARASRASVIVESANYFQALREACEQARRNIFIVGWDFDRREKLGRGEEAQSLQDFFCDLLERHENLEVWLLSWDYAFVYAAEREWFQEQRLRHMTHERLHAHFDGAHPTGGSQHQKLVVIDDRLAFSGGIDLSRWRWDTRDHAAGDSRRTDPDGEPYQPFHDAMFAMDGDAARALGELARARWSDSGASQTPSPSENTPGDDPWPGSVSVQWKDTELAIARTLPEYGDREAVREVEALYLDSIQCAQDYIYIENQFFSARSLATALCEKLRAASGPEVIIVLPRQTGGWLEQQTMDAFRTLRVSELSEADQHGRLRVLYPHQPGLGEDECIMVHAKLMIADDVFLRVGSANASNRSMGLDSECDIALVDHAGDGARWLLHRLLAEHLDVSEQKIADQREQSGSLCELIDQLRSDTGRSLRELPVAEDSVLLDVTDQEDIVDPDEPLDAGFIVGRAMPPEQKKSGHRGLLGFGLFVAFLLLVTAAWRWTDLNEWVDADRLANALSMFESMPVRFLTVFLVIVFTSLMMMPLTALVIASALLLGPWLGFFASMAGALVSAAIAFYVGEITGGKVLERFGESRVHKLSQRLSERGILAIAVLRMIPVAPYTVVNVVAGASHLSLVNFVVGSALGLLPGLAALSWFSDSLFEAVTNPSASSLGLLAVVITLIVGGTLLLRRLLRDS